MHHFRAQILLLWHSIATALGSNLEDHDDPVHPLDDLEHPPLVEDLAGVLDEVEQRLAPDEDVPHRVDLVQDLLEPQLVR